MFSQSLPCNKHTYCAFPYLVHKDLNPTSATYQQCGLGFLSYKRRELIGS